MMTRRQALQTTALVTAAAATVPGALGQGKVSFGGGSASHSLPALPYPFDALEPHIDAKTMEIHHDKHHATYVTNLNNVVISSFDLAKMSVEDLVANLKSVPEAVRTTLRNNAGGHFNHSLFWQMMKKDGGGEPKGELAKAMEGSFGNFGDFKTKFADTAMKTFGSGWAWLVLHEGKLSIESAPNQDNPVSQGKQVLLGLDVWEHAYYLKYQNKRVDYVTAWWNVVNWDFVAERYAKLKG